MRLTLILVLLWLVAAPTFADPTATPIPMRSDRMTGGWYEGRPLADAYTFDAGPGEFTVTLRLVALTAGAPIVVATHLTDTFGNPLPLLDTPDRFAVTQAVTAQGAQVVARYRLDRRMPVVLRVYSAGGAPEVGGNYRIALEGATALSQAGIPPDFPGSQSGMTPPTFEFRLRGSDVLDYRVDPSPRAGYRRLVIFFSRASRSAPNGLEPGEGAFLDRGVTYDEPSTLVQDVRESDVVWVQALRSPYTYWSFEMYNTNRGYFQAVSSRVATAP